MTFILNDMKRKTVEDTAISMLLRCRLYNCVIMVFKGLNGLEMARLLVFVLDATLHLSDLVEQSRLYILSTTRRWRNGI